MPCCPRESMEFRPIEELAEDPGDLRFDDTGTRVLDNHPVAVLGEFPYLDEDIGEETRLLAGVERVVDGLLDGREQRLGQAVESEQVTVLCKELADGYLALFEPDRVCRLIRPLASGPLLGGPRLGPLWRLRQLGCGWFL